MDRTVRVSILGPLYLFLLAAMGISPAMGRQAGKVPVCPFDVPFYLTQAPAGKITIDTADPYYIHNVPGLSSEIRYCAGIQLWLNNRTGLQQSQGGRAFRRCVGQDLDLDGATFELRTLPGNGR
jgi:hypothetical protein